MSDKRSPKDKEATSPRDPEEARNGETHEPINDPDEKKQEEKKEKRNISVLGVICALLEFICFVLIVVATPLDIYKQRVKPLNSDPRSCYSMWGPKTCGDHMAHRDNVKHHGFPCSSINKTMTCAAAFAIISIFFTLVTTILCAIVACGRMTAIVAALFGVLCTIFLCITFACQAGVRNKNCGPTFIIIRKVYMYGPGFGITVAAFALQCVVTILIFLCICL